MKNQLLIILSLLLASGLYVGLTHHRLDVEPQKTVEQPLKLSIGGVQIGDSAADLDSSAELHQIHGPNNDFEGTFEDKNGDVMFLRYRDGRVASITGASLQIDGQSLSAERNSQARFQQNLDAFQARSQSEASPRTTDWSSDLYYEAEKLTVVYPNSGELEPFFHLGEYRELKDPVDG